ncbi:hypothetical protein [Leisingera thetidis]|uniref:hypothetical protein n=1 Tax=Leisingera thetidis TaxID=2930199 RepID=UPI0021F7A547|nr:hypothetical protein [Leisingera thetidis]
MKTNPPKQPRTAGWSCIWTAIQGGNIDYRRNLKAFNRFPRIFQSPFFLTSSAGRAVKPIDNTGKTASAAIEVFSETGCC